MSPATATGTGQPWRARLAGYAHLPAVREIPAALRARRGEGTIAIPSPREVEAIMRRVPAGWLTTVYGIGEQTAARHGATIGCTVTTAIFARMVAQAADEDERAGLPEVTPYWRTLKSDGEINTGYPGGIARQMHRLEAEGHTVVQRGKRFFVQDFQWKLAKHAA